MEKAKSKNSSLNFPLLKIGNFIKEARLSRNQSVSELATDLKISIQQLKAIEEGREDLLPESVFVKAMIKRISERLKLDTSFIESELDKPKDEIKIILESILDTISDIICEEEYLSRIEIRNFGVFEVKPTRAKPRARNPKTNVEVYVPPRRKIHFKPGKIIRQELQQEWTQAD